MDLNTIEAVIRPGSRAELPAWRDGDAFLAGGTWLFSEPQAHLSRLVDLAGLGWPAVTIDSEGLHLAATCRFAELARLELPPAWIAAPLLRQCCDALLGSFKVWNRATVGGNLCMALPAGPIAALAVALDGTCRVWAADGSEREVAASDLVTGPGRTSLRQGEVLRSVDLPDPALRRRTAFRRISLSPLGRSAALLVGTRDGTGRFTLTVTAATRRPVRIDLGEVPDAAGLAQALAGAIPDALLFDDVHGRPEWRRHVVRELAEEIRAELAG